MCGIEHISSLLLSGLISAWPTPMASSTVGLLEFLSFISLFMGFNPVLDSIASCSIIREDK